MSIESLCLSITPFDEVGGVDESSFSAHVDRLASAGVGVIVASSGIGEADLLSVDEHRRLFELAVAAAQGRVSVWAFPRSGRDPQDVAEISQAAVRAGVDAILLSAPDPGGLGTLTVVEREAELRRLLDGIDSTVVLATDTAVWRGAGLAVVPGSRTPLALPSLVALSEDFETIAGMHVRAMDSDLFVALGDMLPSRMLRYGMADGQLHWLALGGAGIVSIEANVVPELCAAIVRAYDLGDVDRLDAAVLELHRTRIAIGGSPAIAAPIKAAMTALGMTGGAMRSPASQSTAHDIAALRARLGALGFDAP